MTSGEILKVARRMQAIAQAGLHFNNNVFDRERYEELRSLSVQLAGLISGSPIEKIQGLFTNEKGFQTPKIDIRSVVLEDGKILLIKEKADGCWSMPGGFADINLSPAENAAKEIFEEAGLNATVKRLLAVVDCSKHDFPPMEFHYYKLIFFCESNGGNFVKNTETDEAKFFSFNDLPPLSTMRNNPWLFQMIEETLLKDTVFFD